MTHCPRCGAPARVRITWPEPRVRDQHGRWVIHPNAAVETHHCDAGKAVTCDD